MVRVFRGRNFFKAFTRPFKIFNSRRSKISLALTALFFIALIGFTFFQTLFSPTQAEAAWYNAGWSYRKSLIIDYTKVGASLTDFPMLVSFATESNLVTYAQSDGDDIVFTSSDGSTKLSHEIGSYNSSTGQLLAWVKVPSVSNVANTTIYMYFGNSSVSSQQNITGVWDSSYKGVWHMNENPAGTAPQIRDSTSIANHGTSGGSMTSGQSVSGKIGNALDFDGSDDLITASDNAAYDIGSGNATWSAWVSRDTTNTFDGIMSHTNGTQGSDGWWFILSTGPQIRLSIGGTDHNYSSATWNTGQFYYVTVVKNGTSLSGYRDGTFINTVDLSKVINNSAGNFRIGLEGSSNGAQHFDGKIDEVRISTTNRSAGWISTEYNNQNSPSTFYTLGNIEGRTTTWYNLSWGYRKSITVDYTKVGGNLNEFPLLVNISGDTSIGANAQGDGDDIVFTYGGTKLNHELEKFTVSGGSADIVAWVRVPFLSSTANTVIYLYYGNSAVSSQQNATAVWDSNYKSVQHLEETGSCPTTFTNSVSASHSGSCGDAPAYLSTSKIGGGRTFDGSNDYITIPDHNDFDIGTSSYTMSTWVYTNATGHQNIFSHIEGTDPYPGYEFALFRTAGQLNISDGAAWRGLASGMTTGNWYYVVAARNGTTVNLYVNGNSLGTVAAQVTIPSSTADLRHGVDIVGNKRVNGYMDEIRFSLIDRSSSWVLTEYNNQNSPSTFYALGSAETASVSWYNNTWVARKRIKIDRTKVTGDQYDFPVLIHLPSDADIDDFAQNDADDFLFTEDDGSTKLNHEIEKYTVSGGAGELVAWVKIPYLSSSVDTYIYLYYGNSSATNQQNPTAVWDSSYASVLHMSESGTTTVEDSTASNNDGTKNSTTSPNYTASGKIAGGQDYNGTTDNIYVSAGPSLTANGTIQGWFYWDSSDGDPAALFRDNTNAAGVGWVLYSATGNFAYRLADTTFTTTTPLTSYQNKWTHYAVTKSGGNVALYLDGSSVHTGSGAANTANTLGWYIMRNGNSGATYLKGKSDEIRFSTNPRSTTWIQTEYNNQNSPSTFYTVAAQELNVPSSPTLIAPSNGATGLSLTPQFQFRSSEQGGDYIQYEIALYESTCTTLIGGSTIQQSSSQTGWTGQDAGPGGNTAYVGNPVITLSTIANYTYQGSPALSWGTQYCWRARGKDPGGSNTNGPYSATQLFTTNAAAGTPTLNTPSASATNVSLTPEFRFYSVDADNDYLRYRFYIYQSDCSTAVGASPYTQPTGLPQTNWAGQGASNATAYNSGQQAIFQLPITLTASTTYCWKAEATDPGGTNTYGTMSATQTFTTRAATPQNTRLDGNVRIEGGTRIAP